MPSNDKLTKRRPGVSTPMLRRGGILALVLLAVFLLYRRGSSAAGPLTEKRVDGINVAYTKTGKALSPPNWEKLRAWEKNLPQHNLDLPYPEGRTGRYVRFTNQIRGLGWNNVLNELLLCAEVAHQADRAYVFEEYTWRKPYYAWDVDVDSKYPMPLTPLNALISGPTAGGNWDPNDMSPRSVTKDYWEIVCPESERVTVMSNTLKDPVREEKGDVIFRHMVREIKKHPARCLEVLPSFPEDAFPQLFDLWLIGDPRGVPGWIDFLKTATSRLLATAPVVSALIDRNEYLFLPRGPRPASGGSVNSWDRMMAVHIRRGDFGPACKERALWASTFYQWNMWPQLPDQFTVPPNSGDGKADDAAKEVYRLHCFPTESEIMTKIRASKAEYLAEGKKKGEKRWLDVMYLLTNADEQWVRDFKAEVAKDGWHTVVTTTDLELDAEGTEVNMAIDMEIARKAAVFIGNGWSSFTSNIVHRRLVDEREPLANRFW